MTEAAQKRVLVASIKKVPGGAAHARRLEDRFAVGLLDLVFKLPGHPVVFAEGKLVAGQSFGPTDRQFEEGQCWQRAGVTVLLLGWKGRYLAVSPWTWLAKWDSCYIGPNNYTTLMEYLDEPRRPIEGQDELARPARRRRRVVASDEDAITPGKKLGHIAE